MSRHRSDESTSTHKRPEIPVFDAGQQINDSQGERSGEIVDVARQYSHPNAAPVHNYLVRWDDGHIEALNERAFTANWGLEVED
jgi:hypothetical protein